MAARGRPPVRLTDEQRKRVEDNLPLVKYVLGRYGNFELDSLEDAYQIGSIGLMRAAASYDSAKSAFSGYAVQCILNQLRMERRAMRAAQRGFGLPALPLDAHAADNGAAIVDLLAADGPDVLERVADADAARRAMCLLQSMHTRPAEVTRSYLAGGRTQVEVGRQFGVSQPYVSREVKRTLAKLRAMLAPEEITRNGGETP